MDRAIFNLTKYSNFIYLHCTDTQINIHYSSVLLPLSVVASVKDNMADFHDNRFDETCTEGKKKRRHAHSHAHTSAPINVIEEQRRGEQNFCRKPEVAYPTIPPHHASNFTNQSPGKGQRLSARRCFLIGLRVWGTVCQKKNFGYGVRWL